MNNLNHTPTDMNDVRDIQDALQIRALGYVRKHAGAYLDRNQLLASTIEYLLGMHTMSDQTAESIAARAVCEHESGGASLMVDLDYSTSYMLVIKDPARGCRRVFSMADIRRLLATAELAPIRTPSYSAAMAGRPTSLSPGN